MTHLSNSDATGQLLIGERLSPIVYHVAVEQAGGLYRATVESSVPRDWLIRLGFEQHATLVLASGDQVELEHDGQLDVSDAISVTLRAAPLQYAERAALLASFPELDNALPDPD
jgi:hypothetical protein